MRCLNNRGIQMITAPLINVAFLEKSADKNRQIQQTLYLVQGDTKKTELTKSLITPEILFSLKQKFYGIMYNLCSQHLQSFNSVQQKLFVLQPLKDMFQMPALTLQALVYTVYVCTYACLRPISSRTAGPIWLILFLLAPSWSGDGFRPKKFTFPP